jgi:hypothetical protein
MQPNGRVLPFPVRWVQCEESPLIMCELHPPVHHCAGGCGAVVSSRHALCLSCAVEDQ